MALYTGPRAKIILTTGADAFLEGSAEEILAVIRDANGFATLQQTDGTALYVRAAHVVAVAPLPDA